MHRPETRPIARVARAKKSLGQHFLRCDWAVSAMLAAAKIEKTDTVLEVGPGTGVLTRELARRAGRVIAVEKDERLATSLAADLARRKFTNVEIIAADILKFLAAARLPQRFSVVANIPYYLTARLLRILCEAGEKPDRIVVMIQKEVAGRIVALPPKMNLLALSVRLVGVPKIIKTVPASCFSPRPNVDSAIIAITGLSSARLAAAKIAADEFFAIARAAFSQKRKLLTSSLGKKFGKGKTAAAIAELGKKTTARPEELSVEEWLTLAKILSNRA